MVGLFATALRHKIWFDLWGAKQRTLQAILTIAIGSFVVGAIFGGWGGIAEDTRANFGPTQPPSISLRVSPPASAQLLDTLRRDPHLTAIEGLMIAPIKWRPQPGLAWQPAQLQARADYTQQQLSLLLLESGAWPHGRRFAVERGFPIGLGARVELQIEGAPAAQAGAGGPHTAPAQIGGVIYNLSQPSAALGAAPTFYVSRALFAELTGQDRFGQIIAAVPDYTPERAAVAATRLQDALRDQGIDVQPASVDNTKVANPNRAFFQDAVESVGIILQSIGLIAVALGLLLVYNTVTAIVAQQTAQIGELKAIGATSRQILLVYVALVFVYGLLALLISVPTGLLAANGLRQMLLMTLGLKAAAWMVQPTPIFYQILICLVAPLLVAALPVLRGARITVREAISSYGLSGGGGWIDGTLARLRGLPRVVSLALSNAFRNPGRIASTQLALVGAGVTFMAVICVRTSLLYTLSGILLQAYPFQIQLDLTQSATLPQVEQAAVLPGVAGIEGWRVQRGSLRRADTTEQISDPAINLTGVPLPNAAYQPVLLAGRTLRPGDTDAIVLHEWLARDAGVGVGDWVLVSLPDPSGERRWQSQRRWQVVGILLDATMGGGALVPRETLFDATGRREVNRIQVRSSDNTEAATAALASRLRAFYEARGLQLQLSERDTVAQRSNAQLTSLAAVLGLLVLVALIVALVGAISLNGMLSLSVLERRREIGVLRAVGATPGFVRSQFVLEGLLMGLLSWLIALLLSYPVALLTTQGVAASLRLSIVFQYDWSGVGLWLLLAAVIAIIASLSPAQQAIRTSVQESLAYE